MMTSEQLQAFDVSQEPAVLRTAYGDTPFGRGCLAARRLIEVGVRCVEVTLDGWDSHVNNHEIQQRQKSDARSRRSPRSLTDLADRGLWRPDDRAGGRRVRPHAGDQSAGRPRPLAARLQHGPGRRRASAAAR